MLPAGSRPSALPLDSPTSWQDKFSVSLEFSSRIPRRGVHMEQSSLAVSHGRDTEHTHAHAHMPMHACTHMRKTSGVFLMCVLLALTHSGFGLCRWREVRSDRGGGRRQGEGAEWLQQAQVWGKDKRGCAGLGPTSGMQQVELLVPCRASVGRQLSPCPARAHPGWRPGLLTPFSVGCGTQLQEFPRFPAAQPICL